MTRPSSASASGVRTEHSVRHAADRYAVVELDLRQVRVLLGDSLGRVLDDRTSRFPVAHDVTAGIAHARTLLDATRGRHGIAPDGLAVVTVTHRDRIVVSPDAVCGELGLDPNVPVTVSRAVDLAAQAELDAALRASCGPAPHVLLHVHADDGIEVGLVVEGTASDPDRAVQHGLAHARVLGSPEARLPCREGHRTCVDALTQAALAPHAVRVDLRAAGVALGIAAARVGITAGADVVVLDGRLGTSSSTFLAAARAAFSEHVTGVSPLLRSALLGRRSAVRGALDLATQLTWARSLAGA